jgi:hypothetical protein
VVERVLERVLEQVLAGVLEQVLVEEQFRPELEEQDRWAPVLEQELLAVKWLEQ